MTILAVPAETASPISDGYEKYVVAGVILVTAWSLKLHSRVSEILVAHSST